jgi:hypothetical protein
MLSYDGSSAADPPPDECGEHADQERHIAPELPDPGRRLAACRAERANRPAWVALIDH